VPPFHGKGSKGSAQLEFGMLEKCHDQAGRKGNAAARRSFRLMRPTTIIFRAQSMPELFVKSKNQQLLRWFWIRAKK
jgi:hypothetical protein